MDLDEWELLPIDGFIDFGEGSENNNKGLLGKRRPAEHSHTTVFNVDLDYFRCPSPRSMMNPSSQVVPVRIQLDPPIKNDPCGDGKEVVSVAADQDAVSKVFFKKMKENEFVDMKILESPRSGSRPISPPIDNFHFEDLPESLDGPCSPISNFIDQDSARDRNRDADDEEANRGGMNIWKWSLTGIGALCSFGVAAVTVITILVIGGHQKQNHKKIRFQIYTDDKRIKEVVHRATKMTEAISAAKGVPLARAHITYGGYYEGL